MCLIVHLAVIVGNLKVMPVSLEFMRGVLVILLLGCAYMTGRTMLAVRRGWQKVGRLYAWAIRTAVCLAAIAFRHSADAIDIVSWCLAAAVFAAGYWQASRPRKQEEDLTHEIFPE